MTNQVNEAIVALRNGDQATALELLTVRLDEEPKDAMAWLWMSEATPDIRRKVEALSQFLNLEPDHTHAASIRQRLQQLQAQLAAMPPIIERAEPSRTVESLPPDLSPTSGGDEPVSFDEETEQGPLEEATYSEEAIPAMAAPVLVYEDESGETDSDVDTSLPSPSFTPRPASPPPPNFQSVESSGDEGLPTWVWVLMVLSLLLVILFIYLIMNIELLTPFLP